MVSAWGRCASDSAVSSCRSGWTNLHVSPNLHSPVLMKSLHGFWLSSPMSCRDFENFILFIIFFVFLWWIFLFVLFLIMFMLPPLYVGVEEGGGESAASGLSLLGLYWG